jgi:diacylglycerol kinase family enzyme
VDEDREHDGDRSVVVNRRRTAALAALLLAVVAVVAAVYATIVAFPAGVTVLLCLVLAAAIAWFGVRRRGVVRVLSGAIAILLLAGALVLVVVEGQLLADLIVVGAVLAGLAAARAAFAVHVQLPPAPRPRTPVLFYNPRSGGGKAERFHLDEEARKRGIEPLELRQGIDLEQLVRGAVGGGADAIAMAGGDGSQAIVAAIAAEFGLPYACIPAGTRNHFALDLGVDRDDVVGALDALVDGGERCVDLAEVNGRVFVNNVSLGLYAEAVQRTGYRDAKMRTLLDTVPDVLGPDRHHQDLTWTGGPGRESGTAILVSNNRYRLGRALESGTRPRLDRGLLGVTVWGPRSEGDGAEAGASMGWRQWSTRTFEIDSDQAVPAGIDGEATTLEPPLRFRSLPSALHVRIARSHPGASPSALLPDSLAQTMALLARFAIGHDGDPTEGADEGSARS